MSSIGKNGYLVGFRHKKILKGKHLNRRKFACRPNTGWHSWRLANVGGKGTLYCDDGEVSEIELSGGFVMPETCSFMIGARSNKKCRKVRAKASLEVRNMVLSGVSE